MPLRRHCLYQPWVLACVFRIVLAAEPSASVQPPSRKVEKAGVEAHSASSRRLVGTRAGEERDDNGLKMNLVFCPAGTFKMGCPKSEKTAKTMKARCR
jgi:hypothetical protein